MSVIKAVHLVLLLIPSHVWCQSTAEATPKPLSFQLLDDDSLARNCYYSTAIAAKFALAEFRETSRETTGGTVSYLALASEYWRSLVVSHVSGGMLRQLLPCPNPRSRPE